MNHDKNDNNENATEREKFSALPRERLPSTALENRIISLLKTKGFIHTTPAQQFFTVPRLAGAFAAALLLLALGFGLGKRQSPTSQPDAGLPTYIMLLYESGESDTHEAGKVIEYSNWARMIAQTNQFIAGEKLQYDGRLLRRVDGQLEVREVAARESAEPIGGYFLIQARNYDEALKIAGSCPHLKYGGAIELRQIDKT